MGTIFLVYICMYVYLSTVCQNAKAELRGPNMRMLIVSFGRLKPTCDTRIGITLC